MATVYPRYGSPQVRDATRDTPNMTETLLRNQKYRLAGFKPVPIGSWNREAEEVESERATSKLFEPVSRAEATPALSPSTRSNGIPLLSDSS